MKRSLLSMTLITGTFMAPAFGAETAPIKDRVAIIETMTAIAAGADRHQWERVRNAFAETVTLDYTSLWGGEPVTQSADDVIAQWSNFLPGFDATQHMITNHVIIDFTGTSAHGESDFQATHRIGHDYWVLLGRYRYEFQQLDDAWKVISLTMTWTHETGDRNLVSRAVERVKPSPQTTQ